MLLLPQFFGIHFNLGGCLGVPEVRLDGELNEQLETEVHALAC